MSGMKPQVSYKTADNPINLKSFFYRFFFLNSLIPFARISYRQSFFSGSVFIRWFYFGVPLLHRVSFGFLYFCVCVFRGRSEKEQEILIIILVLVFDGDRVHT